MTWEEVQAHLRESFVVLSQNEWGTVIGWKVGPAIHVQNVDLVGAFGESWLRIMSHAGPRVSMRADDVLEHNLRLAIGALAARGDSYLLRQVMPLATLTVAQLDQALEQIAYEAARLRADGLAERDRSVDSTAIGSPFAD